MATISVRCPNCDRTLNLKDRSRLGKQAKCPGCGEPFLLKESTREPEPEDVELELVDAAVPVGTAARWVPDEGPAADPAPASGPVSPAPSLPIDADDGGVARLKLLKERRAKRRNSAIVIGAITALLVFGVFWLIRENLDDSLPEVASSEAGRSSAAAESEPLAVAAGSTAPVDPRSLVAAAEPTDGEPIQLYMMPGGVNVVFHLRPADLWSDELAFQELRATLTQNVTDWITQKLQEICRRRPAEIEEAVIGVILGARGTEPELCAVVHLKEDAQLADLIEEFGGEPLAEERGVRLYRSGEYGYLIHDTSTFAICPADMATELPDWITIPNYNTPDGILNLLNRTDRQRLFTVLFQVDDVRRHREWLFPQETRPAFDLLLDGLGENVETMSWSMHLDEQFHSDIYLRTRITGAVELVSPSRLADTMRARIEAVPHEMMAAVRRMNPGTVGARTVIGRYPAMLEAFQRATVITTGPREVRLTTVLPAKAAPNLALATMLTWDESRRTDFSTSEQPDTAVAAADPPEDLSVAERLQIELDAEFRDTPLYAAFEYIVGEIDVGLDIDGDALKDAGYTQNMEQTFELGIVPASEAIHAIISQYDGGNTPEKRMVIAVDEENEQIIVTTYKFAEMNGLEPFPVAPAE